MTTRDASALLRTWNECGFYRLIGMEVTRADEAGSQFRLTVTDEHLQAYGTAHGGILAGLVDAAMGLAILAVVPEGEGCATVEMKLNFLAPAPAGTELTGHGRVLHLGRRLVVAAGEAHDAEGRPIAVGQATFARFTAAA